MAIVFALPRLFERVVARFADEGLEVPQFFGWRAAAEQVRSARRIVWIPGDESGTLGSVVPPKLVARGPRQLATLLELATVEIYAFEGAAPANERAQYEAARSLYDAWLRAVDLAAYGTYQIVSSKWIGGDRTLRAGASIRVVLAVQAPILDEPAAADTVVDAGAHVTVRELDVAESFDVANPG